MKSWGSEVGKGARQEKFSYFTSDKLLQSLFTKENLNTVIYD